MSSADRLVAYVLRLTRGKTAYTPVRPVHPENGQVRFRAFRVVPRHHWRAFLFPQMERNNDENTGFIAIWEYIPDAG